VHTIDLSVTDEEGKTIPLSTTITVKIVKDGADGQDGKPGDPGPKGDTVTTETKAQYWGGEDVTSKPNASSIWVDSYNTVADSMVVYVRY
jgi:hypothetical protein